ncbi:MAG TPA: hypothetical protein VJR06_04465 [Nitrososphaerales archaeon]|nr:hypothetical protein [Nitrososphaerales archaeon]
MASAVPPRGTSIGTKVAIIVVTAVAYVVGKAITAPIPTPWHVGQLLIGIFLPAFFAIVSDTFPAAIGAAIGTLIGDVVFLVPLGATTPVLSLVAGVPANFFGILLFGLFAKRYRSWGGFVASTISFVTLGNLIAAIGVVLFLSLPVNIILGFVVFWNTTSIPAILIGVPILVRAVRPLFGRTSILSYEPNWVGGVTARQTTLAILFAIAFVVLGGVLFAFGLPDPISGFGPIYFELAAALVLILAPITGIIAGSRLQSKPKA